MDITVSVVIFTFGILKSYLSHIPHVFAVRLNFPPHKKAT